MSAYMCMLFTIKSDLVLLIASYTGIHMHMYATYTRLYTCMHTPKGLLTIRSDLVPLIASCLSQQMSRRVSACSPEYHACVCVYVCVCVCGWVGVGVCMYMYMSK